MLRINEGEREGLPISEKCFFFFQNIFNVGKKSQYIEKIDENLKQQYSSSITLCLTKITVTCKVISRWEKSRRGQVFVLGQALLERGRKERRRECIIFTLIID